MPIRCQIASLAIILSMALPANALTYLQSILTQRAYTRTLLGWLVQAAALRKLIGSGFQPTEMRILPLAAFTGFLAAAARAYLQNRVRLRRCHAPVGEERTHA